MSAKQTPEYWREYNRRPEVMARNRARSRAAWARDPELVRGRTRRWQAEHPDRKKAAQDNHRAAVKDGPEFRAEAAERTRRWRQENPDRQLEQSAAKRARKAGVEHVPYRRAEIIERDGGLCHICGLLVPSGQEHLDHVVPISRGGADTPSNVRVAHALCNLRKHAKAFLG